MAAIKRAVFVMEYGDGTAVSYDFDAPYAIKFETVAAAPVWVGSLYQQIYPYPPEYRLTVSPGSGRAGTYRQHRKAGKRLMWAIRRLIGAES